MKARQLGEKSRYRCYIIPLEKDGSDDRFNSASNSAIQVVEFMEDGVPGWIKENLGRTLLVESVEDGMKLGRDKITVTRAGYRQDRRGGISIAVDRFYCGTLGQSSLREDLQREINNVNSRLGELKKDLEEKRNKYSELLERISFQEDMEKIQDAKVRLQQLDKEIQDANKTHKEALEKRKAAEKKLIEAIDQFSNFERDCNDMRKELALSREDQSDVLTELQEMQSQITDLKDKMFSVEEKLDASLLTEKALADVDELDELTPKYYTVRRLLSDFADNPPEEGAVEVYEHHKAQYEKQRQLYEDHEEGLRKWEKEFQLARDKYIVVVEHTITGGTFRD